MKIKNLIIAVAFFLMMNRGPISSPVQIVEPAQEKTVRVLIADHDIQRGERLSVDATKWISWPEKALSESYIVESGESTQEDLNGAVARTRTIFENVRVLAVDATYQETPEAANIASATVTLEFSPQDAESFVNARQGGEVSLALRSVFQPEGEVDSNTKKSSDVTVIRYGRS